MIRKSMVFGLICFTLASLMLSGCKTSPCDNIDFVPDVPRELAMVTHPPYTIAAPDILLIDAIRVVPIPPYKLSPLDSVAVNAPKGLPGEPLQGMFPVEPDGAINLGPTYGKADASC